MSIQDNELFNELERFCAKWDIFTNRDIAMYINDVKPGDGTQVSHGLVGKIRREKCTSPKMRHALGLSPLVVMTEPCRVCGEVHTLKSCNKNKRVRYRVALEFNNWFQQQKMIDLLEMCGNDRKKQSAELMRIVENFKVKM